MWEVKSATEESGLKPGDILDFVGDEIQVTRGTKSLPNWGENYDDTSEPAKVNFKRSPHTITNSRAISPAKRTCSKLTIGDTPDVVWTAEENNGSPYQGDKDKDKGKGIRA